MTRRERLMATLNGKPVDRPAVNFYEIGGFSVDPNDPDPFNVYNDPSWKPLLELAEEKTDIIRMAWPNCTAAYPECVMDHIKHEEYEEAGSRFTRVNLSVAGRNMTSLVRRDPDVSTTWTLEHLLKDVDDVKAYLQLPDEFFKVNVDVSNLVSIDEEIGDRGIVMVEVADPLCQAASLFSMEDYTIIALTEQELFHALLNKLSKSIYEMVDHVARQFPGHLWRICGAEYATEPYLPPNLFEEYAVRYTQPIVESIQRHGGFARIHCHGRISKALPHFVAMGASAIDPVEPFPQGDVNLADVRREYGNDLVIFGNLEIADVENMEPAKFEEVVKQTLVDGTSGTGKGFVLMPTSSPYGRKITPITLANYETMVRLASEF
jgi:hypothetical protein